MRGGYKQVAPEFGNKNPRRQAGLGWFKTPILRRFLHKMRARRRWFAK